MLRGSGVSREALAAIAVAFAIANHVTAAGALPAASGVVSDLSVVRAPDEPFGLLTENISQGPLHAKWQAAFASLAADIAAVSACEGRAEVCAAPAEMQMISIAAAARDRSGLARIGTINRAVNLAVRSMSDEAQYGVEDLWASPLATFTSGAGDCEDYAIAKLAVLRLAGVSAADLRLVILRNLTADEDHAIAAVHLNSDWYLLDNRHLMLVKDTQLDGYRPLFVLGFDSVMRFTEPPLLAGIKLSPNPVAFAGDDAMRLASASFLSIPALDTPHLSHPDLRSDLGLFD